MYKVDADKISKLHLQGKTTSEIAMYFGVAPNLVKYYYKKLNITANKKPNTFNDSKKKIKTFTKNQVDYMFLQV